MTKEQLISYIEKTWIRNDGAFDGNFTKSIKQQVLDAKQLIMELTKFLDENMSYSERFLYIKNNIEEPNTCIVCGCKILDKRFDAIICKKQSCKYNNPSRTQKIKKAKKQRNLSEPYPECTLGWFQYKYGQYIGKEKYLQRNSKTSNTLQNFIKRHGEQKGNQKYLQYKDACKLSQKQPTLIAKYGQIIGKQKYQQLMSKKRMTLENFISLYGQIVGEQKYLQKTNKFKHSISYDGFIQRFGLQDGTILYDQMISKKSMNLERFISCYGEVLGKERYQQWKQSSMFTLGGHIKKYGKQLGEDSYRRMKDKAIASLNAQSSKSANSFFSELLKSLENIDNIFTAALNTEYCISNGMKFYFYDFVDTKLNKIIEYNGDYFHANPLIYDKTFINQLSGHKAEDIWKYDKRKISIAIQQGFDILIIWQSQCKQNRQEMLQKCVEFLQ